MCINCQSVIDPMIIHRPIARLLERGMTNDASNHGEDATILLKVTVSSHIYTQVPLIRKFLLQLVIAIHVVGDP